MHNTCWRVRQTTRNLPLHRHQGLYNTTVSEFFWRFFASTVLIQVICHCNCQECNAYINDASTNDLCAGNLPHLITATSHGRGFFSCSTSQNNHSTVRQQPLCSLRLHSAPATLVSSVAARSRKLAEGLPQQNDLADTVRKKNQCLEEVLHLALATVSSSLANSSTVPCNLSWVGCCCSRGKRE